MTKPPCPRSGRRAPAVNEVKGGPRRPLLAVTLLMVLAVAGCSGPPQPTQPPGPMQPTQPPPSIGTADAAGEDVYITAYTWHDNTPPGSPIISNPVLHRTAGGTGTYDDPITVAVGHSLETGEDVLDYPAGTRLYVPDVRRYFIVEDTCGNGDEPEKGPCHAGAEEFGDASVWLDLWIGGEDESEDFAHDCAREVTGVRTVVFDPADDYVVAEGEGVIRDGECDAGYGDDLIMW